MFLICLKNKINTNRFIYLKKFIFNLNNNFKNTFTLITVNVLCHLTHNSVNETLYFY